MTNVLNGTIDDRESAALGPSKGEELSALQQMCQSNQRLRGREIQGHTNIKRAVDGVLYDQYYLEPTEENLRLILEVVQNHGLQLKKDLEAEFLSIQAILESGDHGRIEKLVKSIQQLRLFDARGKDLSGESVDFHPLTIDIKFKAAEDDQLNRKAIKWRANENGDAPLIGAIDEIRERCKEMGQKLGHVRRYIIAYEWLPPIIVEWILEELNIREISGETLDKVREIIGREFAVKFDVRYDIVTNPEGRQIKMVTREAEINGKDDKAVNWHLYGVQESLRQMGLVTFIPAELNFGELALANDPDGIVNELISRRLPGADVAAIREGMNRQVDDVVAAFGDQQLVVDLEDKAEVLNCLTRVGDKEAVKAEIRELVNRTA